MTKAFISSVISGFMDEREAAEAAVKSLGLVPIMAEQFGAQPSTPRRACLEQVRKSDLFLAILGRRYGEEVDSGKSPSEEEFDEAREAGLPIFVFVKDCEPEERQEAFKKRITNYGEGYFVEFFDSPDKLFRKVSESLAQYASTTDVSVTLSQASSHLNDHVSVLGSVSSSDPFFAGVIMPSDQRERFFSPMELAMPEEKESYQQAALFGSTAILSPRRGIDIVDRREHLELRQVGSNDETWAMVAFHPDGTLAYMSRLSDEQRGDFNIFDYHVMDEDKVKAIVTGFYSYASWFYKRVSESKRPVFNLYTIVALFNRQGKQLGKKPALLPNSMTIRGGFDNERGPLLIPQQPLKIAYARLLDYPSLSEELMHLVVRVYKADGLYYDA